MDFTKIELIGFKSFADKQEILFNDGITAIVGPNGCGKSNIADAIRWVLGEQSAKTLRGSSMQDVIFNGTQDRKSLSYCEVSLYFDNTNKIFPSLDYTEVCMSRKLFRSGESEYSLNKKPCRMKDIIELLHECGVSKGGYSIIGQGKIAEIMNSKPEDRRVIFEEAVGIASSKAKKIENERKLEKTRENIIRIIDVSSELEKDLGPMEEKAEKTREYLKLTAEFRYHEINSYLYKAENSHVVKEKIELRISGYEEEQRARQDEYLKTQNSYEEHRSEMSDIDVKISELSERILSLSVGMEKQSGISTLYGERITNLLAQVKELEEDCRLKREKIRALDKSFDAKKGDVNKLKSEFEISEKRISDISGELEDVLNKLNEGETLAQDAQNKVLQSVESLADIKMNIGALSGEKNVITSQQKEVLEKMDNLSEKRRNISSEKEMCSLSMEQLAKDIARLKSDIEDEEKAVKSTNDFIEEIGNKISSLSSEIASFEAKKNIYKGLIESFNGYPDAIRDIMTAAKTNPFLSSKIKGLVASVIKTEPKYEVAITTALGGALNNIITDNPDDARQLIEYLKRSGGGIITFLPISSVKPRFDSQEAINAQKEVGACGLAAQVVKYDKYYDNVIKFLLGNTLICDNISNAVAVSKKYRFGFKIVTLDGDIINPSGSMTGGSRRQRGSNLLSTERMLEQIEAELAKKSKEMAALTANKNQSLQQVNEMIDDLGAKEDELSDKKQAYASLKEKVVLLEKNLEEVDGEIAEIDVSVKQITARLAQISKAYSDINLDNEKLNEARESASSDALKHQSYYEELRKKRDALIAENTELQTKSARIKADIQNASDELARMQEEREESIKAIEQNKLRIGESESAIEYNKREIEKIALSMDDKSGLKESREELDKIKERKVKLNTLIAQEDLRKQALSTEISNIVAKINDQKMEMTRVDSELEFLQKHIEEEYGLTYDTCIQEKDPEYNISFSNQEMNRIKRRIATLGPINPTAVEEFNALRERYEDYNRQRNDLEAAEADLNGIIKGLTDEMLKIFNEGFEQIRGNFKQIFKELFGGGSADLILDYTDVEDPLEAGVEIVAEPPGKKLTKISLLSGGEQALTATAILFAILRMRPMPFCVLDEIEAPLDDANVERVAEYLEKFATETQFVVITHKKVTMEHANAMFGVTMQEKGVSKIISVKLSDIANNGDIAD